MSYRFACFFRCLLFFITTLGLNTSGLAVDNVHQKLAELESKTDGRLGVAAFNTANGMKIEYRADERFPLGCTSKVVGVGALLKKSTTDKALLNQKVFYTQKNLVNWCPITKKHVETGMTLEALGHAAISYSDNTAMNLILNHIGGTEGMTAFAREIGDNDFRQDHGWPEEAYSGGKGNVFDTTTPASMQSTLHALAFGDILGEKERSLLIQWLKANTTGDKRIRAGAPKGWQVGDKTGSGFVYGTTNDIGILWPPEGQPIVLAIYYTSDHKEAVKRNEVVAEATRLVVEAFGEDKG